MTKYHDAAHTLDPNVEIPDDVAELAPSAGHDEEMAEEVKQAHEEHREQVQAEREQAAEREAEWAERDPKPTPTGFLQESGAEPTPEEDGQDSEDQSDAHGTVAEVLDWVGDDPDRAQQALDAEQAGQNRATLIAELEKRTERTA